MFLYMIKIIINKIITTNLIPKIHSLNMSTQICNQIRQALIDQIHTVTTKNQTNKNYGWLRARILRKDINSLLFTYCLLHVLVQLEPIRPEIFLAALQFHEPTTKDRKSVV